MTVLGGLWDAIDSNWGIEIVMLVVSLVFTYAIIDRVVRSREKRAWEPAKIALINSIVTLIDGLAFKWAATATMTQAIAPDARDMAGGSTLAALRKEISFLESNRGSLVNVRSEEYWRQMVASLATHPENVKRAFDRVQITLATMPRLVPAISKFEQHYQSVVTANEFLSKNIDLITESKKVEQLLRVRFLDFSSNSVASMLSTMLALRDECQSALDI